ncbi:hypothetical protein D3C71_2021590 [compost metagenome]
MVKGQTVGRHVDKGVFSGLAMHPIMFGGWRVGVIEMLTHGLGQHFRLVIFVDYQIAPLVFLQQRRRKFEEAIATAAFPTCSFSYAAKISSINYAF